MNNPPLTVFHLLSSLQTAGAETTSVALVDGLRRQGHEARLATMRSDRDGVPAELARRAGIPRDHLGAARIVSPMAILRAAYRFHRARPCLVHAQDRDAALFGFAAARLARVPVVITRHVLDDAESGRAARAKRALLTRVLRRADRVVAVSGAVAGVLRSTDRVAPAKVTVVPNGLDPALFHPGDAADARARLGWPDATTVTMVAALRPGKGHDVFLAAARHVRDIDPSVRFVAIGDGELRAALEQAAAGCAEFLGARGDIPEVLDGSDIVVLPSEAEALPTVLIEAAFAGRPAVATRVGGVPEVVDEGVSGLLVERADAAAFADAILRLVRSPAERARMGSAAQARAASEFTRSRQVDRMIAVYSEVTAR